MKKDEALEIIRNGESSKVEFKTDDVHPIEETPVIKSSVESIDIAKVNAYLAKLGQTPLNEENERALLHELVNLSVLLDIDKIYYPSLGG